MTHTHTPSVIDFLRNGKQAQILAAEPKSIRRAWAWTIKQLVHELLKSAAGECSSHH